MSKEENVVEEQPVKRKAGRPFGATQKAPKQRQLQNIFAIGAFEGAQVLLEIIRNEKATDASRIAAAKKMIDVKIHIDSQGGVLVVKKDKETGEEKTHSIPNPYGNTPIISTKFGG